MAPGDDKQFSEKHGPDAKPDRSIRDLILKREQNGELPCAIAFEIAKDLGISPSEVGKNIDLLNLRLVKCQLGLFGHRPQKRIVVPAEHVSQELQKTIEKAMDETGLSCAAAWEIADQLNMSRLDVSSACEALQIKISSCQLGTFGK